jgi:hypothetical protein
MGCHFGGSIAKIKCGGVDEEDVVGAGLEFVWILVYVEFWHRVMTVIVE